jgi:FMN-dependent NADH-azoreductase
LHKTARVSWRPIFPGWPGNSPETTHDPDADAAQNLPVPAIFRFRIGLALFSLVKLMLTLSLHVPVSKTQSSLAQIIIKNMKSALHIISSARGKQSYSRQLSEAIIKKLLDKNEIDTVVERDLTKSPPPFLDEALIGEFYKLPEMITGEGKQLLNYANSIFNEMYRADIIVIGTPMHNLGISSLLKAWIDQLVRVGVSYRFNDDGTRTGCLNNKKVYLAIASGGRLIYLTNGYEFIESYIKAVFSAYVGITDVTTYRIEGTAEKDLKVNYQQIIQNL